MEDNRIRDFDIPMSIQDQEARERFLKIPSNSTDNENRWHSNHYSTSAYICYYLMRTNPFTDSMIKFQSNNFGSEICNNMVFGACFRAGKDIDVFLNSANYSKFPTF